MNQDRSITPPSRASHSIPQLVLRTKWNDEKSSVESLIPPESRFGFGDDFIESEIVLDESHKLYVRHAREGKWIEVRGGGTAAIHGVVMETIALPPDVRADPSDPDFMEACGKVKIDGKLYEPIEDENGEEVYEYDLAACVLLATGEYLLAGWSGEFIESVYKNPDFDPDQPESDENFKSKKYYKAVKLPKIYMAELDADVPAGGDGTFKRKDANGIEYTFQCSGKEIPAGATAKTSQGRYDVERRESFGGRELVIVAGPCPIYS